jgi:transcriptional regulator with XRE-family HTH domain
MGKINIGAVIAARRKEKGLTQEELADYLGVSKPAVSKWESGQSYPDILLLPVLASFFNTSVDELIGYEAQMTKAEIRKLYERFAAAFAAEPFDTVYAECREYVRKYHSCWNLVYSIAQLFVNHAMLAGGPEAALEVLRETSSLLETVEKECGDPRLARDALSMRAYCCLALGQPAEAIDILGEEETQQLTADILLAKAYALKGDGERARSLLQRYVFTIGNGIVAALPDLMALYANEPKRLEDCVALALNIGEAFKLRKTLPHQYFTLTLTAAALFTAQGNSSRALDMLELYTDIVTDNGIYPLKLRGNEFFDLIEPYFDSLNLGNSAPRSEKLIKKDMKDAVINNPAFFGLVSDERYRCLVSRLEHFE